MLGEDMKGRSYNSVGAGEKPVLGKCYSVDIKSRPGSGQSFDKVKVDTEIPKTGRPGGNQGGFKTAGPEPRAARPGGAQGI